MADEMRTAARTTEADAGSVLFGTWELQVKTPFGQHPATLDLRPDNTGSISSKLGDVSLQDLQTAADSFTAGVAYPYQGRTFNAKITGHVEGHSLNGQINVDMPIAPALKFTGEKRSAVNDQ